MGFCHHSIVLKDVERRKSRSAGHGMSAIGVAVGQLDHMLGYVHGHHAAIDLSRGEHCAHGNSAVRKAFSDIHHIRLHTEGIGTKGFSSATKACDHFIENQQYVVFIA